MKKYILLSIVCISSILFTSCEENPLPNPAPPTKIEIISTRPWKFSSAFVSSIDVSTQLPPCQRDNIFTFSVFKTGLINEGGLKCNTADPQERNFDWDFNGPQTELYISSVLFTGGNNTFTIVSLTSASMVLSQNVSLGGGSPQPVVVTFVPN